MCKTYTIVCLLPYHNVFTACLCSTVPDLKTQHLFKQSFVQVTYERMEKVLHALEHDTDAPGRHLLDIAFAPMARAPHFSEGAPKWTPVATNSLDVSQRSAVALALAASDIALIHGPPGAFGSICIVLELQGKRCLNT